MQAGQVVVIPDAIESASSPRFSAPCPGHRGTSSCVSSDIGPGIVPQSSLRSHCGPDQTAEFSAFGVGPYSRQPPSNEEHCLTRGKLEREGSS